MELFAHCRDPEIFSGRVVLQFFVLRNRFFHDGVDNAAAIFFNVDNGARPVRTGSNLECFEMHNVVNGLQGDAAWSSWGD